MSSEQYREQGIAAAKARRTEEARKLLQQALKLNPEDELAWLYLASVTDDKKQRLRILQRVLEINPQSDMGRKAVKALGVDPDQLLALSKKAQPEPEPEELPQENPFTHVDTDALEESVEDEELPYSPYDDDDSEVEVEQFPTEDPFTFTDTGAMSQIGDDEDLPYSPYDDTGELEDLPTQDPFTSTDTGAMTQIDDDDLPYSPYDDDDDLPESPYDMGDDDDFGVFDEDEDDDFGEFEGQGEVDPFGEFEDDGEADPFADYESDEDDDFGEFDDDEDGIDPFGVSDSYDDDAYYEDIAATIAMPDLPKPPEFDQSQPGIPTPDLNYLEAVLVHAEGIGNSFMQSNADDIEWQLKEKRLAGQGDLFRLRLQIYGTATVVVLILLSIGGYLALTNPDVQKILMGSSPTPTFTPTFTPTNTPGATETPTATLDTTRFPTYTPSPTINPTFTPVGIIGRVTPRPTEIYRPVGAEDVEVPIRTAIAELEDGNVLEAIGTLERERGLVLNNFNPNPYYYNAFALAESGEFDEAFEIMEEAEARMETEVSGADIPIFQSIIDLGFAEIYFKRGAEAYAEGDIAAAQADFESARERAEATIDFDPRYTRAHILIADTYAIQGDYEEALTVIAGARTLSQTADAQELILEQGALYLTRGYNQQAEGNIEGATADFNTAEEYAREALYLNDFNERAHQIRIEAALALGRGGDAFLYTRDYRVAFPDTAIAFAYVGDARLIEGNTDLALEAYARALDLGGENAEALSEVYLRRAELYLNQRRYAQAQQDLTSAYDITGEDTILAERMRVAYQAGDYETALADAEALRGSRAISANEIAFLVARIEIDQAVAEGNRTALNNALNDLNNLSVAAEDQALYDEYQALANYNLDDYENALVNIEQSLQGGETGLRYFLRGQIREAMGEDLLGAKSDYEWVLTWNKLFGYTFADQAEEYIPTVQANLNMTATVDAQMTLDVFSTATAEALQTQVGVDAENTEIARTAFFETSTAQALITPSPSGN